MSDAEKTKLGALDWRVVALVAALAGGGGGSTLVSMLRPVTSDAASAANLEEVKKQLGTLATRDDMEKLRTSVDTAARETIRQLADHEARLKALEK